MDKFELQKLRDLPIEGVAERLGLRVTQGHKSLCPFHDDHTASLSFCVRRNTCRCFVCMNESLGTIDLVMKHLRLDFKEACRWLADGSLSLTLPLRNGIGSSQKLKDNCFDPKRYERFFERPWLSTEARRFLFDERKLHPRVISWSKVNSWRDKNGVNWLQIPYYDMEGKLIGVQNRNLDYKKDSTIAGGREGASRFRFPTGSKCSIYNQQILKLLKPGDELWIAEGCSDAWSLMSSGRKAIAIPSATLLKPDDIKILTSLSASLSLTFHMYPDRDLPGERLFLQLQEKLSRETDCKLIHHQLTEGCKDFSEMYIKEKLSHNS